MDHPDVPNRLLPGLEVHLDADPAARARALAAEHAADLCTTAEEVEELLADLAEFPSLGAEDLELVQRLGERVAAAERIIDRSLERAAGDVRNRLSDVGSGVAIHPTTVRDRAAAVVGAREALQAAEERLVNARAEAEAEAAEAAAAARSAADAPGYDDGGGSGTEAAWARRRRFGLGRSGRARRYEEDTSESTSLLQQMAASTDEAFGARRAIEARSGLLLLLDAQRARALEDVRVAERSWTDLAGSDPVEDVELVVQRFDPQYQEAREVAQDVAGVRAAASLLERATQRWEEGWRSVGLEPPKSADPQWMARLSDRATRAIVLVEDAAEQGDRVAEAAPAAPVLVVKPAS